MGRAPVYGYERGITDANVLMGEAGVPCIHLAVDFRCQIFGAPKRPACCSGLQPSSEMCGSDRDAALLWLANLEAATMPPSTDPGS